MNLRTLLHLAAPYRSQLITVGVLTVGSSLVLLAVPWLAGHMIGGIISQAASLGRLVSLLLLSLVALALLNTRSVHRIDYNPLGYWLICGSGYTSTSSDYPWLSTRTIGRALRLHSRLSRLPG